MFNAGYWPRKSHFLTEILSAVVSVSPLPGNTDSTLPVLVKVGHVTPYTQLEKYGVLLSDTH